MEEEPSGATKHGRVSRLFGKFEGKVLTPGIDPEYREASVNWTVKNITVSKLYRGESMNEIGYLISSGSESFPEKGIYDRMALEA